MESDWNKALDLNHIKKTERHEEQASFVEIEDDLARPQREGREGLQNSEIEWSPMGRKPVTNGFEAFHEILERKCSIADSLGFKPAVKPRVERNPTFGQDHYEGQLKAQDPGSTPMTPLDLNKILDEKERRPELVSTHETLSPLSHIKSSTPVHPWTGAPLESISSTRAIHHHPTTALEPKPKSKTTVASFFQRRASRRRLSEAEAYKQLQLEAQQETTPKKNWKPWAHGQPSESPAVTPRRKSIQKAIGKLFHKNDAQ
ncbi:hypothetical protein BY458DRAFT_590171 [Sporodiniella umbellata]|nr:hypothetical protein BY458DRAFT_590171 [Sporodiniella umbellata]